ncbi:DDE transposase family protein [Okeania sp. KiyG1]|uniref:DDE transposase family protein n=1 Tax=Okeania sp. KiyG1 TaxID=2720165 RepID=UPI001923FFB7|nr:DDE transposase family protein [Okeania sp. KiyG1]GGA06608.1 hypothetical protein CYANOKiyG1_19040 [Okeania sp. KiyG1]
MNDSSQKYYIIKKPEETCEILPSTQVEHKKDPDILATWGPFNTVEEAIACRVGLIRSGKCQPQ